MKRIDLRTIRQQMDALLIAWPEIGEDEILRADMFEAETELNEFLEQMENIRQEALERAEGLTQRLDALLERRRRFNRREEAIRELIFKVLQWGNLKKVTIDQATYSIRRGVPHVVIVDEQAIPDQYCKITRDPMLGKIRAALNAFETVPGAELSNAEPMLAIRIK